jgi:hypothetical protein
MHIEKDSEYNMKIGPNIPTDSLKAFFDVSNPKCVDATATIDSNTRLNNLVDGNEQFKPYDTTNGNMTFVLDNGSYVYNQVSTNAGYPGWESLGDAITRVDDYSFVCWFKYTYGSSTQRSNNIYGGGFHGETSWYLSPSGTSQSHGVLRYSDAGGTNSYSVISAANGGNDGNWHMFGATDAAGGAGNQTTKVYIDGVLKQTATSNSSHDTPDNTAQLVWGSWSKSYGNFGGRSNCFMYYEKVLSDSDMLRIYNGMKKRFG